MCIIPPILVSTLHYSIDFLRQQADRETASICAANQRTRRKVPRRSYFADLSLGYTIALHRRQIPSPNSHVRHSSMHILTNTTQHPCATNFPALSITTSHISGNQTNSLLSSSLIPMTTHPAFLAPQHFKKCRFRVHL